MKKKTRPTDAELEILNVLWKHGPCSVRLVNESLSEVKEVGYTTTLKIMQIMLEKGLVSRDTSSKKHLYEAAIPQETTQHHLLSKLADMAFGGNNIQLAMRALDDQRVSKEEISELRKLLDNLEKREQQ